MKIDIIHPAHYRDDGSLVQSKSWIDRLGAYLPHLGPPLMAALTPDKHQVRLTEEYLDDINFESDAVIGQEEVNDVVRHRVLWQKSHTQDFQGRLRQPFGKGWPGLSDEWLHRLRPVNPAARAGTSDSPRGVRPDDLECRFADWAGEFNLRFLRTTKARVGAEVTDATLEASEGFVADLAVERHDAGRSLRGVRTGPRAEPRSCDEAWLLSELLVAVLAGNQDAVCEFPSPVSGATSERTEPLL